LVLCLGGIIIFFEDISIILKLKNIFMSYIFVLLGFIILIKGADFLVDGASALAKKWGVSSLVIGLTVVAFGTSAPELFINVFSALK